MTINTSIDYWPNDDGDENEEEMASQLKAMGFNLVEPKNTTKEDVHTPSKSILYLAGPMEVDLDSKEKPYSVIWRQNITQLLAEDPNNVWDVRDPTKNKINKQGLYEQTPENSIHYNSSVIYRTDRYNVESCHYFVANYLQNVVGVGTQTEFGWADTLAKFIIVIAEKESPVARHPFISERADVIVSSVQEAAQFLMLFPKVAYDFDF